MVGAGGGLNKNQGVAPDGRWCDRERPRVNANVSKHMNNLRSSITISSLAELLKAATEARQRFPLTTWWRGLPQVTHDLVPGVFRPRPQGLSEPDLLVLFQAFAPTRYKKCPAPTDLDRWLQLAQHYRLPTRLLDWTESVLVAAYFATLNHESNDAALWSLGPFNLNQRTIGQGVIPAPSHPSSLRMIKSAFGQSVGDAAGAETCMAVLGTEIDLRMLLQHGRYTLHNTPTPLNAEAWASEVLIQYVILGSAKEELRGELNALGYRRATLFPDLDSLAEFVKNISLSSES